MPNFNQGATNMAVHSKADKNVTKNLVSPVGGKHGAVSTDGLLMHREHGTDAATSSGDEQNGTNGKHIADNYSGNYGKHGTTETAVPGISDPVNISEDEENGADLSIIPRGGDYSVLHVCITNTNINLGDGKHGTDDVIASSVHGANNRAISSGDEHKSADIAISMISPGPRDDMANTIVILGNGEHGLKMQAHNNTSELRASKSTPCSSALHGASPIVNDVPEQGLPDIEDYDTDSTQKGDNLEVAECFHWDDIPHSLTERHTSTASTAQESDQSMAESDDSTCSSLLLGTCIVTATTAAESTHHSTEQRKSMAQDSEESMMEHGHSTSSILLLGMHTTTEDRITCRTNQAEPSNASANPEPATTAHNASERIREDQINEKSADQSSLTCLRKRPSTDSVDSEEDRNKRPRIDDDHGSSDDVEEVEGNSAVGVPPLPPEEDPKGDNPKFNNQSKVASTNCRKGRVNHTEEDQNNNNNGVEDSVIIVDPDPECQVLEPIQETPLPDLDVICVTREPKIKGNRSKLSLKGKSKPLCESRPVSVSDSSSDVVEVVPDVDMENMNEGSGSDHSTDMTEKPEQPEQLAEKESTGHSTNDKIARVPSVSSSAEDITPSTSYITHNSSTGTSAEYVTAVEDKSSVPDNAMSCSMHFSQPVHSPEPYDVIDVNNKQGSRKAIEKASKPIFYQSQKEMASLILERIKLMYKHYHDGKSLKELFTDVDFRIYVPRLTQLQKQTVQRSKKCLQGCFPKAKEIRFFFADRVHTFYIPIHERFDMHRSFVKLVQNTPTTLYLVIADECHWGVTKPKAAETSLKDRAHNTLINCWTDAHPNVLVLQVSATPFNILTANSRIPKVFCRSNEATLQVISDNCGQKELHVINWKERQNSDLCQMEAGFYLRCLKMVKGQSWLSLSKVTSGSPRLILTSDRTKAASFKLDGQGQIIAQSEGASYFLSDFVIPVRKSGTQESYVPEEKLTFTAVSVGMQLISLSCFVTGVDMFVYCPMDVQNGCCELRPLQKINMWNNHVTKSHRCFLVESADQHHLGYMSLNTVFNSLRDEKWKKHLLREDYAFRILLTRASESLKEGGGVMDGNEKDLPKCIKKICVPDEKGDAAQKRIMETILAADYTWKLLIAYALKVSLAQISGKSFEEVIRYFLELRDCLFNEMVQSILANTEDGKQNMIKVEMLLLAKTTSQEIAESRCAKKRAGATLFQLLVSDMETACHKMKNLSERDLDMLSKKLVGGYFNNIPDETLILANDLLNANRATGRGQMVIIRLNPGSSKNPAVEDKFYYTLCVVRDILAGWERKFSKSGRTRYLFDVIRDHRTHNLSAAMDGKNHPELCHLWSVVMKNKTCENVGCECTDHLIRPDRGQDTLECNNCGHQHQEFNTLDYGDLDGLPCIVLVIEKVRMGSTLPASFRCFDLRLREPEKGSQSKTTLIQELGRLCRFTSARSLERGNVPYALVGENLYDLFRKSLPTCVSIYDEHFCAQSDKYTNVAPKTGLVKKKFVVDDGFSNLRCTNIASSDHFDHGNVKVHKYRLLLTAEPQIGKTGTYMCLIKYLKNIIVDEQKSMEFLDHLKVDAFEDSDDFTDFSSNPLTRNTNREIIICGSSTRFGNRVNATETTMGDEVTMTSSPKVSMMEIMETGSRSSLIQLVEEAWRWQYPYWKFMSERSDVQTTIRCGKYVDLCGMYSYHAVPSFDPIYNLQRANNSDLVSEVDELALSYRQTKQLDRNPVDHSLVNKHRLHPYSHFDDCAVCFVDFGKLPRPLRGFIWLNDREFSISVPKYGIYSHFELTETGFTDDSLAVVTRAIDLKPWIFVPTSGRPQKALLNYRHSMEIGDNLVSYIQVLVVRAEEFSRYQRLWGRTHMIICLPGSLDTVKKGGVGYARKFIQQFATNLGLKFIFVLDDNIAFVEEAEELNGKIRRSLEGAIFTNPVSLAKVLLHYQRFTMGLVPVPQEALMENFELANCLPDSELTLNPVSQYSGQVSCYAVLGMLKSRPGATRVRQPFKRTHCHSFVLLNLEALHRCGVEYKPYPAFEDITFNIECDLQGLYVCKFNRFTLVKYNFKSSILSGYVCTKAAKEKSSLTQQAELNVLKNFHLAKVGPGGTLVVPLPNTMYDELDLDLESPLWELDKSLKAATKEKGATDVNAILLMPSESMRCRVLPYLKLHLKEFMSTGLRRVLSVFLTRDLCQYLKWTTADAIRESFTDIQQVCGRTFTVRILMAADPEKGEVRFVMILLTAQEPETD